MSATVGIGFQPTMHPELDDLLMRSLKRAFRLLKGAGKVPLFAAVLDAHGKPQIVNMTHHPEWKPPKTDKAMLEFLRASMCDTGTSGTVIGGSMEAATEEGKGHPILRLHADHIDDPCAYLFTMGYVVDEDGNVTADAPVTEETDDLILPRTEP